MIQPSSPLSGVRVLDLSECLAGRWSSMLLAEQGADVVRFGVTSAGSSALDAYSDRGKRVCTTEASITAANLEALSRSADLILTDGRWVKVHGYAPSLPADSTVIRFTGETLTDEPPDDDLLHAKLGVFTDVSVIAPVLGLPPIYTALSMASAYGAVLGANAAVAALLRRRSTGQGEAISIPLAASVMAAMGSVMFRVDGQPWRYDIPPLPPAVRWLLPWVKAIGGRGGTSVHRWLRGLGRKLLPPMMRFYTCADGRKLLIFALDHRRLPIALLETLGLWDSLRSAGLQALDPYTSSRRDNVCDAALLSPKWKRRIAKALSARFREATGDHWESVLSTAGVPCAVVRTFDEWQNLAWVRHAGLVDEIEDPVLGAQRQFGTAVSVDHGDHAPRPSPREILRSLPAWKAGGVRRAIVALSSDSARLPLQGVRVLDLASMVAGPICARTLAELGADVLKLDPVNPLHGPRMTAWYGIEMSHGKRSALIDLQHERAGEILDPLFGQADVVVHNFTGAAGRRITERISRASAIECAVSAFGGPLIGPWTDRKGYDPILQAAAGVASRFGSDDEPELHAIASCVDCLTGYLGAYGVLCGLFATTEEKQSPPPRIRVSLAQAVQFIQGELQLLSKPLSASAVGAGAVGRQAFRRLYKARDAWLFLDLRVEQATAMAPLIPGLALTDVENANGTCARQLGRFFSKLRAEAAIALLQSVGVTAVRVRSLGDWHRQRSLQSADARPFSLLRLDNHPCGHPVTRVRSTWLRSVAWNLKVGSGFPKPGSDTRRILLECGIDEVIVDTAFRDGIAGESLSTKYLPS
ncbi:MAG: hypothetical protein JWQ90_4732 [Hydrocarboniphaga sp.]|uniref:CoA transferase n=1 Tax=Hydrocarboniphaga sp. TaxID=2033016 RepID=UPI00260EDD7F|nr:CoA transferase [Hydrocarboniphaga sp.]MDB5972282.1 hypothetical protein [Hydrocarboniphaga sp.]